MGSAVKGVGQQAESIALKMAKVRNEGDLAEARKRMIETSNAFNKEVVMKQSMPEDQWLGELDKRFDALQKEFDSSDIAPDARGDLERTFFEFRAKQNAALELKAFEQSLDRARTQHMGELDAAVAAGDREGVVRASRVPGLPSHEQDDLARKALQRIDDDEIYSLIEFDPIEVQRMIKDGEMPAHMGKKDIARIHSLAEGSRSSMAGDEAQEIWNLWKERKEIKTEADLRRHVDAAGYMNDKEKRALITRIMGGEGVSNDEFTDYYGQIRALSKVYGKHSPENYQRMHNELMRDLNILGDSEGAETLRRIAGGISLANQQDKEGRGPKQVKSRWEKIGLAMIDDLTTEREERVGVSKTEQAVAVSEFVTALQLHPEPEKLDKAAIQQMADAAWATALDRPRKAMGAGIKSLMPEALKDTAPGNPLLPPKDNGIGGWRPGGI